MQSPENNEKYIIPRYYSTILQQIQSCAQKHHCCNQIPHAISSCQRNVAHVHRINGSLYFHREGWPVRGVAVPGPFGVLLLLEPLWTWMPFGRCSALRRPIAAGECGLDRVHILFVPYRIVPPQSGISVNFNGTSLEVELGLHVI